MSYESPVNIREMVDSISEMETKRVDDLIKLEIRSHIDVEVDDEELIKALQYDRDQYQKGYQDGVEEARKEMAKDYISIAWLEERASEFGAISTYARTFAANFLRALIRDWKEGE